MRRHTLPEGHHDATSAATLLGISKKRLLKTMRELGWLYTGGTTHNMPRQDTIRNGLARTQDRSHGLRGAHKNIGRQYQVMLLTQNGFQTLKKILTEDNETMEKMTSNANPPTHRNSPPEKEKKFNRESSNIEREKALSQLRDWGIAS